MTDEKDCLLEAVERNTLKERCKLLLECLLERENNLLATCTTKAMHCYKMADKQDP